MRRVELTQGQIALIDDDDWEKVSQFSWCAAFDPKRGKYTAHRRVNTDCISLHRFIMNAKPGEEIDHINRNPLDNRRGNLRVVDRSINRANTPPRAGNTSGYKGIRQNNNSWCARIMRNGKEWTATTLKKRDAALVRDAMARLLYPEGIYLNFPDEEPGWAAKIAREKINP